MSNPTFSLQVTGTKELRRAARQIQLAAKKFGADFVIWRAAIVCKDFIWFLPPRGRNPSDEGSNEQKERGWKNVSADIKRVFRSGTELLEVLKKHPLVGKHPKLGETLQRYIAAEDYANLSKVLYKMGSRVALIPQPLQEQHFQQRNSKTGRVFKRPSSWYYVLNSGRIQGYVTLMQRDVGKLKSGCLVAANKLKSLGGEVKNIPAWVSRHHEPGSYLDQTKKSAGYSAFTITNQAKGAERFAHILPVLTAINQRKMLIEARAKMPYLRRTLGTTSRLFYRI